MSKTTHHHHSGALQVATCAHAAFRSALLAANALTVHHAPKNQRTGTCLHIIIIIIIASSKHYRVSLQPTLYGAFQDTLPRCCVVPYTETALPSCRNTISMDGVPHSRGGRATIRQLHKHTGKQTAPTCFPCNGAAAMPQAWFEPFP